MSGEKAVLDLALGTPDIGADYAYGDSHCVASLPLPAPDPNVITLNTGDVWCDSKIISGKIIAADFKPNLVIFDRDNGAVVTVNTDGTVVLNAAVDEASKKFWEVIGDMGIGYAKKNSDLLKEAAEKDSKIDKLTLRVQELAAQVQQMMLDKSGV